LSNWANAIKALDEVSYKEKKSFENLKERILNDNKNEIKALELIKKEQEKYYKREKQILKIRKILEEKKRKYIEKIEKQRFEIRFKKIKDELNILV
jgi:hypothetical protein